LSLSDRIAVMTAGRIRQLGTPDEIYRQPSDRFVASFVGDVNVLRARLERINGTVAVVALGEARVDVPSQPLAGASAGSSTDLFLRPEQLSVVEHGPAAIHGVIAAQIYQGGHVDLYVDVAEAESGRVLLRVSGEQATAHWPAGTRIGIGLVAHSAIAFVPSGS